MGAGAGHKMQPFAADWRFLGICIVLCIPQVFAQVDMSQAVEVTTPDEFQQQVRLGVAHIVITEHLNMTNSPRFAESTVMNLGMISVDRGAGGITQTIRGNCSKEQPGLEFPRRSPTQCVITVLEDFMEAPTEGSQVWVSDLYVMLAGVGKENKEHSTLVGVHGADVYLTGMSFIGDRTKARAIDVKENRKLYISGFSKDKDGVIRFGAGSIGTIVNTTFKDNVVSTSSKGKVAAGPVAGLQFDGLSSAASVWFQGCVFDGNEGLVAGDVSVASRECRVYSNTWSPTVWDLELSQQLSPWLLAPRSADSGGSGDVFEGRSFPTENDVFFVDVAEKQAMATGLPAVTPTGLPEGRAFITRDPYPSSDDSFWTGRNIALVVGLGGTFIVIMIGMLVWYFCYFKPEGESETFMAGKKMETQSTEAASAVPAMYASQYASGSYYSSQQPTESGFNPVTVNKHHSGPPPSVSSHASMPHAGPGGYAPPYGASPDAAAAHYGGGSQIGSRHHSAYGPVIPPYGVPAPYGAPSPYGAPAPYGVAGSMDRYDSGASDPNSQSHQSGQALYGMHTVQVPAQGPRPTAPGQMPEAPPATYGAAGQPGEASVANGSRFEYVAPERVDSNVASSVAPGSEVARQMFSSLPESAANHLHDTGAGSSMVTASEANQSAFSVQPLPPMQASAAAAPGKPEPPLAGGAVESTVEDTGIVPAGIDPNWQSNPEAPATKPSINGAAGAAAAAAAAAAVAAPAAAAVASVSSGGPQHQEGVPHTATISSLAQTGPEKTPGVMNLGNTTDARAGPFSTLAASSQPKSKEDAAAKPSAAAKDGGEKAGEGSSVFLPRVPFNRSATYVFDKTVAPDQDISDISHETVSDMLEDVFAAKALFRDKYQMMGAVHQRLGGSGIVQFATTTSSNVPGEKDVALKFYIKRAAFDRVAGMHATPTIKSSMGAILEVVSNNEEDKTAARVLPPCVIMKRGENLEDWALRLRPNLPTSLNALCALADLLKTFHGSGHVYYGFKPANVAWFSEEKRWMLIDFACGARKGMRTGLNFALNYAAPEIILAQEAGTRTLAVDPAADIWALGVTAYELLTGARTFEPGTPTSEIRNMISGRLPLPWEEHEPKQLRTLRHSVLSCLARNPSDRPTAADIHGTWRNLLDFAAVKHTEVSV